MMSKFVKRVIPFESCDIPAIQSWLEDMAKKGLLFMECGVFFAKFEKGEPKDMRYRLDFCDVVACDIPEEKKELYERSGWNVVGDFKNDCVVICTENPDAPEIYTDCELLVKPLKNIMLKYRIYVAALCVMLLTALVHCGLPDSVGVIRFLCNITTPYLAAALVLIVLLAAEIIFGAARLIKLKAIAKRIKNGADIPNGEKGGFSRAVGKVLIPLAIPITVAWAAFVLLPDSAANSDAEITDFSALPFPTCEDLGWKCDEQRSSAYGSDSVDSPIVNKRYFLSQNGDVNFQTEYVDMNSEHAAKLLSEDKIERLKQYDEASYNTAMQRRYELERDGYEINDAPEERMLYEYDADGAHVFYLRADHRGMDFHRQYIIVRYKSIYIEVSCESTDRYLGDLIPQYISLLKGAK